MQPFEGPRTDRLRVDAERADRAPSSPASTLLREPLAPTAPAAPVGPAGIDRPAPPRPRPFATFPSGEEEAAAHTERQRRLTRRLAQLGLTLCGCYLLLYHFSVVRGSSMAPGIRDGDRILIDQLSYWFGSVQRGDIVVLRYPPNPELDYIKRVVGLPGDEIVLACGLVWVNGELLDEPYIQEADSTSIGRVQVAKGCVFVLGDNRPHSSDSREFGLVPLENLRGKVDLRVWPPARFGWIQ